MADVVVIGGGPAGLYGSMELARRGFKVVLLEDHQDVGERVLCTGIIGTPAFDQFSLPRQTILGAVCETKAVSKFGTTVHYRPSKPLAYLVDKRAFNLALADYAEAAGVELRSNSRAEDIMVDAKGVRVAVRPREGERYTLTARVVLITCGVSYALTKRLGLGRPRDFLHGAQTEVPRTWTSCTEIILDKELTPDAFGWVVPMTNGWTRVGVMTKGDASGSLQRLLDRSLPEWREIPDIHLASKPIAQSVLNQSYLDRVLVVGEAAGQVKGTTGGGIYFALLCAHYAVEATAHAFAQGSYNAPVLAQYERAWRAAIGEELWLGHFFRRMYARLRDEHVDALLGLAAKNGLMDLIREKADFDWHRDLIVAMLKSPSVQRIVLKGLLGL